VAEEQIIGIGTILGGTDEATELALAVDRAWQLLSPIHRQSKESVRIAALLMVPGPMWQPKRVGVRLGRFLPEESLFEVRIALGSNDDRDPLQSVWHHLDVAIERIDRTLRKRGSLLTTVEARTALDAVRNLPMEAARPGLSTRERKTNSREARPINGAVAHVLVARTAIQVQRFADRVARDGFIVAELDNADDVPEAKWFGVVRVDADASPGLDVDADFLEALAGLYDITYDGLETFDHAGP
jgi:hypothetical protein